MTKPNFEATAAEHLRRQGYQYYYPRHLLRLPNKKPVIRPLFARYIFVLIDTAWYGITGTRGISRVLMGPSAPEILPTVFIEALKKRESKDGLVSLPIPPKFSPGQQLRARNGPLEGQLLIYEGMSTHDRVRVLFSAMGRQCSVELAEKALVAA